MKTAPIPETWNAEFIINYIFFSELTTHLAPSSIDHLVDETAEKIHEQTT